MSSAGKILLTDLEIENFLSHVKTRIVFEQGVTAFVGRTGAGKSSIIDAIYFALTGKPRRGGIANLINDRSTKASVRLRLNVGGVEIIIERTLRREHGGRVTHNARLVENGRNVARTVQAVSRRIEELLEMPARSIDKVMIIPQGEITRLLTEERSERMRILDLILGISSYEEAYNQLVELDIPVRLEGLGITLRFKPSSRSMPGEMDDARRSVKAKLEETRVNLRRIREEKSRVLSGLKESEKLLAELKPKIREAEEHFRRMEELRDRYKGIKDKEKLYEERLEKLLEEEESLERRLSELKSLVEEAEKLRPLAEAKAPLEELANLIKEKHTLTKFHQQALRRLEEVSSIVERLRELEEKYGGRIGELASMADELEEEEERLEEEERRIGEEISRLEERLRALKEAREKLQAEENQMLREALLITNTRASSIREALEAIEKLLKSLAERRERLEEENRRLGEEIGSLEGLLKDAEEKMRILSESKANRCPLCGSPLTPQHKEEVLRKLRREASEYERRITILKESRRQIEEKLRRLNSEIQSASSFRDRLRKTARSNVEETGRIVGEEEEIKGRLEEARRKREAIEKKRRSIEESLRLSRRAREDFELYSHLKGSLRPGEPQNIEREVQSTQQKLREIDDRISELKRSLLIQLGHIPEDESIPSLAAKASRAYERLREIEGARHRIEELESRLSSVRTEEEEAKHTLRRLREEEKVIMSEGYSEEAYLKARQELMDLQRNISKLEERLKSMKDRLGELEARERESEEAERKLQADLKALEKAGFKLRVLRYIREKIFHRDHAPSIIRERKLREVEDLMRDLLEKFNLSYSDVRVSSDFTITLLAPNGVYRSAEMLSGGERVSASIAALLALHQVAMKGRLGFLVMDEPTIHLDAERRRHLIELLGKFRGGGIIPQLIIVTHDEDVRDASDHVYEVRATARGSRVERLEEPLSIPS